jgi:hypothetical protein
MPQARGNVVHEGDVVERGAVVREVEETTTTVLASTSGRAPRSRGTASRRRSLRRQRIGSSGTSRPSRRWRKGNLGLEGVLGSEKPVVGAEPAEPRSSSSASRSSGESPSGVRWTSSVRDRGTRESRSSGSGR